jgi:hypothetical protein
MVTAIDRSDDPNGSRTAAGRRMILGAPSGYPLQPDAGTTTLPVTVRPLFLRDVPRLRALDTLYPLNQPEALVVGYGRSRSGLRAASPWGRRRRPAFVADAGDRLVGYAEFRSLLFDGRWMLTALGASVGVYDADPVWEALLPYAVRQAGLRGVKRLYGRIPWEARVSPAFRRLGWHPYATETVFLAHDLASVARSGLRPRRQDRTDTWAVHQLYAACVPREVQDAEAFTSHRWDVLRPGHTGRDAVGGWLFENDHQLVGYARVLSNGAHHAVELLVLPERRDLAGDVIDGVLAALGAHGVRRVYCAIRGYQAELSAPLGERGFLAVFEQELFVRYTTATVRRSVTEMVPFTLDVRDPVPGRVPTFFRPTSEDGSAG